MTITAFPITLASITPFARALKHRLDHVDEMDVLIRFCASVSIFEPQHSLATLYQEFCAAIDARNDYAVRSKWLRSWNLAKPSYATFVRRIKIKMAWPLWPDSSQPDDGTTRCI